MTDTPLTAEELATLRNDVEEYEALGVGPLCSACGHVQLERPEGPPWCNSCFASRNECRDEAHSIGAYIPWVDARSRTGWAARASTTKRLLATIATLTTRAEQAEAQVEEFRKQLRYPRWCSIGSIDNVAEIRMHRAMWEKLTGRAAMEGQR